MKNEKCCLSIIIPVYNAGKYLRECLSSVVKQKLPNFEVICINDGSTDESLDILQEFASKYEFIKIINKKNGGVISARILGYDNASGEYIGWVDADDFVDTEMFSILYENAIKDDADVSYCNYNFYPNEVINKQKWYKDYEGNVNWKFIMNNTIQWNKIVKKELLDHLNITELFETVGEGCYGLVLINAKKIVSIDKPLYNYRVGHSSLSSNFKNVNWYKKVVDRSFNMLNYVEKNEYSSEWCDYYRYRYLYYNLILMISSAYSGDKKTYISSKKIINSNNLFAKKYKPYLKNSFSLFKIFFLKLGASSYLMMRLMSKLIFH